MPDKHRKSAALPDRRDFIKASAIAAASTIVGCGSDEAFPEGEPAVDGSVGADGSPAGEFDAGPAPTVDGGASPDATPMPVEPPEQIPLAQEGLFPIDIASGDATTHQAMFRTLYTGELELELAIWKMAGDQYAALAWADQVTADDNGYVRVDADALEPGAHYRYAFFELVDGERVARSRIGSLRAALADDAMERLVFGAGSCAQNGREFPTLGQFATQPNIDGFLLVGDAVYADGAFSVQEYRDSYLENFSKVGYRDLFAATSVIGTWDDHEIENNWDGESVDPDQFQNAMQAWFENVPARREPEHPERFWRRLRWGRTLEFFVLDCRAERKPSTRSTDQAEYISPEQLAWLKQGLTDSQAVFKVILNSVPISDFPILFDAASADRWEGYPAQRTELLQYIQDAGITGILWVAGDFHLASMGRVAESGLGSDQVEALVGPIAQRANPLSFLLNEPQFDWAASQDNYTLLDFDPERTEVTITYYGPDGDALATRTYNLGG